MPLKSGNEVEDSAVDDLPCMNQFQLPSFYPILDASYLAGAAERAGMLRQIVRNLAAAGVRILQYRNKAADESQILADARILREVAAGTGLLLILNDYPALAVEAGFDGVHVGQTDMPPDRARRILGSEKILGVSTHNDVQLCKADSQPVDYIAVGPVFATATKENPDPVIGVDGVQRARQLSRKPLVAIGGITAANAPAVLYAGADSVAVISAIFQPGADIKARIREFPRT